MLSTYVSDFLNYKSIERGLSDHTREKYSYVLGQFCASLGTRSPLHARERDVRDFLASWHDRKLSPSTINNCISCLREFFKHLLRDGLIERDPMIRIELMKQRKALPKAISKEEVLQLIYAPPPVNGSKFAPHQQYQAAKALRDHAICELFYSSGIRESELLDARLEDLKLAERTLVVDGKGEKQRTVPFGQPAVIAVRNYLNDARPLLLGSASSPHLFFGRRGEKVTRMRVWQIINDRAKRAGIAHVSPHVLRHSLATHMLDNGADLRTLQTILGHSDISTTQIYTKVSQEHLRDVLARCNPRWKPGRTQMQLFETQASMPTQGLIVCIECTSPAVVGKTRCERHLRLAREACGRFRERLASKKGFKKIVKRTKVEIPYGARGDYTYSYYVEILECGHTHIEDTNRTNRYRTCKKCAGSSVGILARKEVA